MAINRTRIILAVLLAGFGLYLVAGHGHLGSSGSGRAALTSAQAAEAVKATAGQRGFQVKTVSCHVSSYAGPNGDTQFDCAAGFYPLAVQSVAFPTMWCVTAGGSGVDGVLTAADDACAKLPLSKPR